MNGLMPIILIGVILLILALQAMKRTAAGRLPVVAKPLMTASERQILALLEGAVPHARVHAKVCMSAIVKTAQGLSQRERMSVRGRFSQKMIDFVLEDRATGRIIALVEHGKRQTSSEERAKRDAITRAAGYLSIRLPDTRRPSAAGVRDVVLAALSDHAASDNTGASHVRGEGMAPREVTA